jgi:hypothetical protein
LNQSAVAALGILQHRWSGTWPSRASPVEVNASPQTWPYTRRVVAASPSSHLAAAATVMQLVEQHRRGGVTGVAHRDPRRTGRLRWRVNAFEYVSGLIGEPSWDENQLAATGCRLVAPKHPFATLPPSCQDSAKQGGHGETGLTYAAL